MARNDIAPYATMFPVNPPFSLQDKLQALRSGTDNPNVNIYNFTYNCVALTDMWIVYDIDPVHLALQEKLNPDLAEAKLGFPYMSPFSSAHPLPEPGTNHHLTFVSSYALVPNLKHKITLVRVKSSKDREMVTQWHVKNLPYMHSFSVTKNYAVYLGAPYYYKIGQLMITLDFSKAVQWFGDSPTFIYTVSLKSGQVQIFKTETIFTMHHVNAYEIDDDHIALDVATFDDATAFSKVSLDVLRNRTRRNALNPSALIKRYVLNMKDNTVDIVTFPDGSKLPYASKINWPTINENYRSRKYCFVYGIALKADNMTYSNMSLVKKDLCGNSTDKAWFLKNHYLNEAWFVSTPGGTLEDDGILMMPVTDGVNRKSFLAMIEAQNMTLINRADLPTTVPLTIHGRMFDL